MLLKTVIPYVVAGATGAVLSTLSPLLLTSSKAENNLLPFQGRLTDAAGSAIADGAKVVEFKMYDAPTGGNVKWAGEVHKLSVNGGLVNTMLGSKSSLGTVDFSTPCYLQITVDANTDNQITAADPPLLPRQSVIPAVYASIAGGIQYVSGVASASVKGEDLFDASGKVKGQAIAANDSLTANQLGPASVNTSELGEGVVTLNKLAADAINALGGTGSVTSQKILDGDVRTVDLAGNATGGVETIPGAVISEKIKNGTILAEDLAAGILTSTHFNQDAIPARLLEHDIKVFAEKRPNNVMSGLPSGTWTTRSLNTVEAVTKAVGSSISFDPATSRFSLAPGVYRVSASACAWRVSHHQLAIRNVTVPASPVVLLRGLSQYNAYSTPTGSESSTASQLEGCLTVGDQGGQFDLAHFMDGYSSVWGGTQTMGVNAFTPAQSGEENVYSRITIERIK